MNELENLNKQIRISDVISVLVAQSTNLIDIVNKNQIEVNRLKYCIYLNLRCGIEPT